MTSIGFCKSHRGLNPSCCQRVRIVFKKLKISIKMSETYCQMSEKMSETFCQNECDFLSNGWENQWYCCLLTSMSFIIPWCSFLQLVKTSGGGSNLWKGPGLANLTVRILESAPSIFKLGWNLVLFFVTTSVLNIQCCFIQLNRGLNIIIRGGSRIMEGGAQ